MDHLIFYKNGVNLKDRISPIRFSYTREYLLIFASNPKDLVAYLRKYSKALLYFFTDELSKNDRISISNIKNNFKDIRVNLCSNKVFALDAWLMDVFNFTAQPVASVGLEAAYKKYISKTVADKQELCLKTKEGIVRIPFNMINYLKANGNYTQIALRGGKSFIETKQLQQYDYFTERDFNMKRLHRSYIFNMKNIKQVGNKKAVFYATDTALELSMALEKKIKKSLLSK